MLKTHKKYICIQKLKKLTQRKRESAKNKKQILLWNFCSGVPSDNGDTPKHNNETVKMDPKHGRVDNEQSVPSYLFARPGEHIFYNEEIKNRRAGYLYFLRFIKYKPGVRNQGKKWDAVLEPNMLHNKGVLLFVSVLGARLWLKCIGGWDELSWTQLRTQRSELRFLINLWSIIFSFLFEHRFVSIQNIHNSILYKMEMRPL